jgi:hypothetical protein
MIRCCDDWPYLTSRAWLSFVFAKCGRLCHFAALVGEKKNRRKRVVVECGECNIRSGDAGHAIWEAGSCCVI